MKTSGNDTIVAISTPAGEGGIGVVRLSGPRAIEVADALFRAKSGKRVSAQKSFTARYGHVIEICLENKQRVIDEIALESFSHELVKLGEELTQLRRELAPRVSPLARLAYRRIASEAEELRLEYQPSVKQDFAEAVS